MIKVYLIKYFYHSNIVTFIEKRDDFRSTFYIYKKSPFHFTRLDKLEIMIRIKLFVLSQPEARYSNISWFKVEEFIVNNTTNHCFTVKNSICVKTNDYYLVFDTFFNDCK
jgi:hypothetical protein